MGTGPTGLVTSSYSEKDGGSDEDKKYVLCAGIISLVGLSAGCGQKAEIQRLLRQLVSRR